MIEISRVWELSLTCHRRVRPLKHLIYNGVCAKGRFALLQITPHQKFLEGKLAEPDLVFHVPALSTDDDMSKEAQHSIYIDAAFIGRRNIRDIKGNPKIAPEFL